MSDSEWTEPRVLSTVIEVIDDYLTPLEPDGDLDTERAEALRYHFEQAYVILKYPEKRPPRRPGQKDVFAAQARENAAANREDTLLADFHSRRPLVQHTELVQLILHGVLPASHREQEDAALARALSGYASPGVNTTGWPAFDTPQLAEHCRRSLQLDLSTDDNAKARAISRYSLTTVDPSGSHWLTELVRATETLLYDRDCRDYIGKGSGKRTRLEKLADSQYAAWLRARHPVDAQIIDLELINRSYYETERAEFDHMYDRIDRTRTRFATLYDILGPALLLDPTWTTQNCLLVSKPFVKLVKDLDKTISENHDYTRLRRQRTATSQATLFSLVEHMAPGQDFKRYLDHFFDRCSPAYVV